MSQKKFYSLLVGIFVFTAVFCVGIFYVKQARFSARDNNIPPVYVSSMEKFEDFQNPAQNSSFGFGSVAIIRSSAESLAPFLTNCRQYKVGYREDYRFDVKVEPTSQTFRVVGILTGADENPEASQCLRDKINNAKFPRFSELKSVPELRYRIILSVQEARANEAVN